MYEQPAVRNIVLPKLSSFSTQKQKFYQVVINNNKKKVYENLV